VHESQVDEYVAKLGAIADAVRVGDPFAEEGVQMGPIIDDRQFSAVRGIVDDAVAGGAQLVTGGPAEGRCFRPTVLSGVRPEMSVWKDEIFGPVAPVTSYSTIEEAIELVNASEYGLSVAILGDAGLAMDVSDQIRSGVVHVNEQTVGDEASAPFGGMGASGNGSRFGGPGANFEAFTETQWVTVRSEIETYKLPS